MDGLFSPCCLAVIPRNHPKWDTHYRFLLLLNHLFTMCPAQWNISPFVTKYCVKSSTLYLLLVRVARPTVLCSLFFHFPFLFPLPFPPCRFIELGTILPFMSKEEKWPPTFESGNGASPEPTEDNNHIKYTTLMNTIPLPFPTWRNLRFIRPYTIFCAFLNE